MLIQIRYQTNKKKILDNDHCNQVSLGNTNQTKLIGKA